MGPLGWCLSCLLLWAVAFPAYLVTRRRYCRAPAATAKAGGVAQDTDLICQLGELADLHSQGLLTDEEFQVKKKALVREMLEQ